MILDALDNLLNYSSLNKGLGKAIEFLSHKNLNLLPVGKHEIDGRRVFVIKAGVKYG